MGKLRLNSNAVIRAWQLAGDSKPPCDVYMVGMATKRQGEKTTAVSTVN